MLAGACAIGVSFVGISPKNEHILALPAAHAAELGTANLIGNLRSSDENVQYNSADALAKVGKPAVPALIEALKDKNESVREYASWALVSIAREHPKYDWRSAAPALIDALKDENWVVRANVATAFAETDDASAVPALIERLRDEDSEVRARAATALEWIGDKSAVPSLMKLLNSYNPDAQRSATARVLEFIAQKYPEYDWKPFVPVLIEKLGDNAVGVRRNISGVLWNITADHPDYAWKQAFPALINSLGDKDEHVQFCALWMLRRFVSQSPEYEWNTAVYPLLEMLESNKGHVRDDAVHLLGNIAGKHPEYNSIVIPALIEALNDWNLAGKESAAWALVDAKDLSAIPALLETQKSDDEEWKDIVRTVVGHLYATKQ